MINARKHSDSHTVAGFGQLLFNVRIRKHCEAPHTWMVSAEVSQEAKKLGSTQSLLFLRDRMRSDFHGIMEMLTDETWQFGTSIFAEQGNIRPELLNDPVQKGSGVWGTEINQGSIVLLEKIRVVQEHRRKGLGQWLLAQTLKLPEISDCKFAFAWPTVLNLDNDCPESERESRIASILRFFHKAGFRRVGRTCFLGYALGNTTHPARLLPMDSDPSAMEVKDISKEEAAIKYPLHEAIANKSDEELVDVIKAAAATNIESIRSPDFDGNTPLHKAALLKKVQAVRQLIALGGPQAVNALDYSGYTPLEALQTHLSRELFGAIIAGRGIPLPGYGGNASTILSELATAMGKTSQPTEKQDSTKQWGCTCGQCLEGWLSSRMKYRLNFCAEVTADMIDSSRFPARTIITDKDLIFTPMSEHIPIAIRKAGIYPSYLKGYRVIFGAIANLLSNSSLTIPSAKAVATQLSSSQFHDGKSVDYYFSHGGKIDHALYGVVRTCMESSPLGDNSGEEIYQNDLRALPECQNDLAFELVCERLGLPSVTQVVVYAGAYSDDDEVVCIA